MNIGVLASQSGIAAKTIRYYEDIGLIQSAQRSANGYRVYSVDDTRTLRFIHRARSLGFSLEEISELLDLWMDRSRSSAAVKSLAARHIAAIDRRIAEMRSLRRTIDDLVRRCHGDDRPDCPILEDLAQEPKAARPPAVVGAPVRSRNPRRTNDRKVAAHR